MGENRVRIIGGRWRSRLISFPARTDLRPTPDRVRETLFNWLGQDLTGRTCLDLFAGSGALGFEALSRGAHLVVMVESNPRVLSSLKQNAAGLDAQNMELAAGDALQFLAQDRRSYDVIFLDPPFHKDMLAELLPLVEARLAADGMVYVESARPVDPGPGWSVWRSGRAGKVFYVLLRKNLPEDAS